MWKIVSEIGEGHSKPSVALLFSFFVEAVLGSHCVFRVDCCCWSLLILAAVAVVRSKLGRQCKLSRSVSPSAYYFSADDDELDIVLRPNAWLTGEIVPSKYCKLC